MGFLDGGIRDLVNPALDAGLGLLPVEIVSTTTTPDPADPTEPSVTTTATRKAKGMLANDHGFFARQTVTRAGDMGVVLSRTPAHWTPPVVVRPQAGDRVTVAGQTGVVRQVFSPDAAGAQWLLDCAGAP